MKATPPKPHLLCLPAAASSFNNSWIPLSTWMFICPKLPAERDLFLCWKNKKDRSKKKKKIKPISKCNKEHTDSAKVHLSFPTGEESGDATGGWWVMLCLLQGAASPSILLKAEILHGLLGKRKGKSLLWLCLSFCPQKLLWKQLAQLSYGHLSPVILLWPFHHLSTSNWKKKKKRKKTPKPNKRVINRYFLSSAFRECGLLGFFPHKTCSDIRTNGQSHGSRKLWAEHQRGAVSNQFALMSNKFFTHGKGHT